MKTSGLRLKLVELNFFASFTTDNHGLELVSTKPNKIQYHDQKEPEHKLSHLDQEGVLQVSQVMVQ